MYNPMLPDGRDLVDPRELQIAVRPKLAWVLLLSVLLLAFLMVLSLDDSVQHDRKADSAPAAEQSSSVNPEQ